MGKTGTTAIQKFLVANRSRLQKHNVFYPRIGLVSDAHHLLSPHHPKFLSQWDFVPPTVWGPKLSKFKGDNYLISSELIAWASSEIVRSFCNTLLDFFHVKVVLYVRRQDNLVMSGYNQQLKAGTQIGDITAVVKRLHRFNYEHIIHPWAECLGKENILVFPYERKQFYKGDVRTDFLYRVFGIDDNKLILESKNSNPRLSVVAMEFKRLINNIIKDTTKSSEFNEILIQYSNQTNDADNGIFTSTPILSPEDRLEIINLSEPINKKIAVDFLNRSDGRLFYDPLPALDSGFSEPGISADDLMGVANHIKTNNKHLYNVLKSSVDVVLNSGSTREKKAAKQLSLTFLKNGCESSYNKGVSKNDA